MANIFIFSNAFLTRTFIYKIGYLLNINIDKIILLKENHSLEERFQFVDQIKVETYANIDFCVSCSDCVIIINDKYLQKNQLST